MTTSKLICIFHSNTDFHSRSVCRVDVVFIFFFNAHPLRQEKSLSTNTHHPSSYILILIIPGVPNTLSHSYMASLPLPPFLLLISCHCRVFMGPYRKFQPTDSFIKFHLYFLHTFCCSSIYLTNVFLTCMLFSFFIACAQLINLHQCTRV